MIQSSIETAGLVLAKASAFDQTFVKPDDSVILAWAEAIGDRSLHDCLDVVTGHYRSETRRLMPADVLAGVRRIRDARIAAHPRVDPPPDINPDDFVRMNAWQREINRRIGDGEVIEQPRNGHELPPRDVKGMITGAIRCPRCGRRDAMVEDARTGLLNCQAPGCADGTS